MDEREPSELYDRSEEYSELQESPYLRRQKPIEVRRSRAGRHVARYRKVVLVVLAAAVAVALAGYIYWFLTRGPRFALADEKSVEVRGTEHVPVRLVREKFGADSGKSIFAIPLAERRHAIEEIPWVENATLERVLPNQLRVVVRERTPMAFLRLGSDLALVDAQGAVLEKPQQGSFDFPVLNGITQAMEPRERARRIQLYLQFLREVSSAGPPPNISEIDLSDPEDLRAMIVETGGVILIHFGDGEFLKKMQTYAAHITEWKQTAQRIDSVDLRFEGQVIVNPESKVVPTGATGARP